MIWNSGLVTKAVVSNKTKAIVEAGEQAEKVLKDKKEKREEVSSAKHEQA